jgi:DNA-binding LytR/AlgR family response regulator
MNIRCYIIDDESDAIMLLKRYIARTAGLELAGSSRDPLVALDQLTGPFAPDLTFIDVDMRQLSGLELAGMVNQYTSVVFTTAHPQFAIQAFQKEAWDYLLKPIGYEDFLWSIQRARKRMVKEALDNMPVESFFTIKSAVKGRMVRIRTNEVMYIEGAQNYIHIHTANDRHMTYLPLKEIEQRLPPEIFVRIHRSFMVNVTYIRIIERNRIILYNGTELMLGDHYKQRFLQMMDDRLLNPGKAS